MIDKVCVCVCEQQELYFERQDSGDKGSAIDLSDGSSLRHVDGLQLFDGVHGGNHLTSTFRVVTPDTDTHTRTQLHKQLHTAGTQFC